MVIPTPPRRRSAPRGSGRFTAEIVEAAKSWAGGGEASGGGRRGARLALWGRPRRALPGRRRRGGHCPKTPPPRLPRRAPRLPQLALHYTRDRTNSFAEAQAGVSAIFIAFAPLVAVAFRSLSYPFRGGVEKLIVLFGDLFLSDGSFSCVEAESENDIFSYENFLQRSFFGVSFAMDMCHVELATLHREAEWIVRGARHKAYNLI